jgi:hypothetical protein
VSSEKRGPERLVEVKEVVENERPYLRIVLADVSDKKQTRKKGLSPSKKYARTSRGGSRRKS